MFGKVVPGSPVDGPSTRESWRRSVPARGICCRQQAHSSQTPNSETREDQGRDHTVILRKYSSAQAVSHHLAQLGDAN